MTEWKEYTGSDEQIAEMNKALCGFVLRYSSGIQTEIFKRIGSSYIGEYIDSRRRLLSGSNLKEVLDKHKITNYLICNPHPLADMICQQAMTGQSVWVSRLFECGIEKERQIFVTTTPDWNIPNAEYSFTEFKGEV